jgi:AbrB family looped-hinge helix DNA binding protein
MSGSNIQYNPTEMFKEWIQKSGKAQADFMKTFGSMMGQHKPEGFEPVEALKELMSRGSKAQSDFVENLESMQSKAIDSAFKLAQTMPQFVSWGAFKTSVGSNGRISIPEAERDALGLKEGDLVQVVIIPIEKKIKKRGGEMMSKTTPETKEIYATYKQNVDKFFDDIEKAAPQYLQSITNLQQEYTSAWRNAIESAISQQQEFATKAGINTNVPAAVIKAVNDGTEEMIKARAVQNKVVLAVIDAAKQNIKTFNENAKAFAGLNENLYQSWISAWIPTRN